MGKGAWILCAVIFLSACSGRDQAETMNTGSNENKAEGKPEEIAGDLHAPWSIQKHGDVFYINERSGSIKVIEDGTVKEEKVHFSEKLSSRPESGFLGFLLAPDFKESAKAYAYYTYDRNDQPYNRIVLLNRQEEGWNEKEVLLDDIPSGQFHHGGRLEFGMDGKLYAATGDALQEDQAQNKESLSGKILRMNLNGTVPDDNPSKESYVYSYGHRNPQGLAWDEDGNMYSSEHGPSGHDEINQILADANYGWPSIKGNEEKQGMELPLVHSGDETWAPSGLIHHEGYLYFAALRGEAVKRYHIESGNLEDAAAGYGRIRDVFEEGGIIYFISNNTDGRGDGREDKLYQLIP